MLKKPVPKRTTKPNARAWQTVRVLLDRDVIEHFKKKGPGWQSRMNSALRAQAKLK